MWKKNIEIELPATPENILRGIRPESPVRERVKSRQEVDDILRERRSKTPDREIRSNQSLSTVSIRSTKPDSVQGSNKSVQGSNKSVSTDSFPCSRESTATSTGTPKFFPLRQEHRPNFLTATKLARDSHLSTSKERSLRSGSPDRSIASETDSYLKWTPTPTPVWEAPAIQEVSTVQEPQIIIQEPSECSEFDFGDQPTYTASIRLCQSPVPCHDISDVTLDDPQLVINIDSEIVDSSAKYKYYTKLVADCARAGKTFQVIHFFDVIRIKDELKKRGYIEVPAHKFHKEEHQLPIWELIELAEPGNEFEQALIARLLGNYPADYVWVPMPSYYHTFQSTPWLNKIFIEENDFTLKDGLCDLINKLKSKSVLMDIDINYPRAYIAYRRKEVDAFRNDFKFTKLTNFLQFLFDHEDIFSLFHMEGTVEMAVLDTMFTILQRHMKNVVEKRPTFPFHPDELEWRQVEKGMIEMMNNNGRIRCVGDDSDIILYYGHQLQYFIGEVARIWPAKQFDGIKNLWVLKPANTGQGYGVVLTDDEAKIMDMVNNLNRRYIIQKYIERPLLVYRTKFDIRQYFLVTIEEDCISCWSHPVCSFKFASRQFTVDDLHESIHITNTSIQHKYMLSRYDDSPLPIDHLWSQLEFIEYLKEQGIGYKFDAEIYPAMKKSIRTLAIGALPHIDLKPGRFELFGCDWILGGDFSVYLLEVNAAPGLNYDNPVLKYVCGTVMEDTVRVTVDYMKDKRASTGQFELLFTTPVYKNNGKRFVNVREAEKSLTGKLNTPTSNWVNYLQTS